MKNEDEFEVYLEDLKKSIIITISKEGKISMLKNNNELSEVQMSALEKLIILTTEISIVLKLVLYIEILLNKFSIYISNKFKKIYK